MSRINAIQKAIDTLNGGQFQKMMDTYFSKRYSVYSVGSVFGDSNPKKGTPDALIRLNNNRYIFIEYTVQRKKIIDKILDDIESCLEKEKTNIKTSQIEKIICCTKVTLDTKDIDKIYTKAESENIELELLTGDVISRELLHYPTVVKDYLNIEIDTEQILDIEDFIRLYNHGRLATPLDNELYGREDTVKKIVESLENGSITILSGAPGVGKTRLAIDCLENFKKKHPEYVVRCFRYNGLNFYEDLEHLLEKDESYLLFIDDANQLTQLELILDALNRNDLELKLILTVREYAREKLLDKLGLLNTKEIEIGLLEDSTIKTICKVEYGITNQLGIEQIIEIAKGNARLAIMAAETAVRENKLSSLGNPGDLLNVYFKSVKNDFEEEFNSQELLMVSAIIGFLGSINLKDKENLLLINNLFNVKEDKLKTNIEQLHNMEIIDVYNNYVVKISDQILSTFIFYYTVFEKEYLRYSDFIKGYFPRIKNRIIEHLNGITFYYSEKGYDRAINEIKEIYNKVEETGTTYDNFIHTFWFALGIDPLIYADKKIKVMEVEKDKNIDYDISKNALGSSELVDLLGYFSDTKHYKEALELTFQYLDKNPSQFKIIYDSLIKNYGYNKNSSLSMFRKQKEFLNFIKMYLTSDDFTKQMMLLRIAQYFLKFDYDYAEAKGRKGVVLYSFSVVENETIYKFRQLAWNVLKTFINNPLFRKEINQALVDYGKQYSKNEDIKPIVVFDKKHVLEILYERSEKIDLSTSIAFGEINDLFSYYNLEFEVSTKKQYETTQYQLLKAMIEKSYTFTSEGEEQKYRLEEMEKLIDFNSIGDFKKIFNLTREVTKNKLVSDNYAYMNGLSLILVSAHPSIMKTVLEYLFIYNLEINLNPLPLIREYSNYHPLKELEEIAIAKDYDAKDFWLFSIIYIKTEMSINIDILNDIYHLFEKSNLEWLHYFDIHFFTRFLTIDQEVFIKITKKILDKDNKSSLFALEMLFNPYATKPSELIKLYRSDLNILKKLYLKLYSLEQRIDYNGEFFKSIIQEDISFLDELFDCMISKKINGTYSDNNIFSVLWEMNEWEKYINHYFTILMDFNRTAYIVSYFDNFFDIKKGNSKGGELVRDRQIEWVKQTIIKYYNNEKEIKLLFSAISNLHDDYIIQAAKLFVEQNSSFDLFKKLQLQPNSFSWSGSEIPLLKRRRNFYSKLKNELVGIQYLQHKKYLQEVIDNYNKRIEEVTVKEFMEDL